MTVRGIRRRSSVAVLVALVGASIGLVSVGRSEAASVHYLAPDGDDAAAGTEEQPWATFEHALEQLRAGDTLRVRGGRYEERVTYPSISDGTADAPITVIAVSGERPVIEGLLWVSGADHWVFDGVNVTWDADTGQPDEHMVKLTNGVGWTFTNAEVWGARSYAGVLVAGTVTGEPAGWSVTDSCIHDTYPTNDTNQDHNLYVNTGLEAGAGTVERNLLFGADNGENIKLAGGSSWGGAANVTVRYNTLVDAAQNVLVGFDSHDIAFERNLIVGAAGDYGNIRGYRLDGDNVVATDNAGFDASQFILNDDGYPGVTDGGGNRFPLDPQFDAVACDALHPGDDTAAEYGRWAGETTTTDDTTDDGSTTESTAPNATVTAAEVAGAGGRHDDKHLDAAATLAYDDGSPASGLTVGVALLREDDVVETASLETDDTGTVDLRRTKVASGCWSMAITGVDGADWDGATPDNQWCK